LLSSRPSRRYAVERFGQRSSYVPLGRSGRCRRHRIVSTQLHQISCNKGRWPTKRKPLYERSLDSSSGITRTYFWIPRSVRERLFESWRRCSESCNSKPVIRRYRQPFQRLMNGAAARDFSAMITSRLPCDETARTAAVPFEAAVNFAPAPRSEFGRYGPLRDARAGVQARGGIGQRSGHEETNKDCLRTSLQGLDRVGRCQRHNLRFDSLNDRFM